MVGYSTGTAKDYKEEEEEEKFGRESQAAGDKPYRGKSRLGKENAARACSERVGNLAVYATGISNKPEEEKKEEYASGNRKQPARNPVGGNQVGEKENEPTSALITLGIHGGAEGRFTKQATTFPEDGNKTSAGTKSRELHRVLMGENPILQNTIEVGNEWGGAKGTTPAPIAVHQQDVEEGGTCIDGKYPFSVTTASGLITITPFWG